MPGLRSIHRRFRKLVPAVILTLVAAAYRAVQELGVFPKDVVLFPFLVLGAWILFLYWVFAGPRAVRRYNKAYKVWAGEKRIVAYSIAILVGAVIGGATGAGWWKLFEIHRKQMATLTERPKDNKTAQPPEGAEKGADAPKKPIPDTGANGTPEKVPPKIEHPKSTAQAHETNERESAKSAFLGVHKPSETTVIPPGSSAIISPHPLSPEDQRDIERLESEDEEATKHLKHELGKLTVRDLFWSDFRSPENTSVRHSGFTIRNGDTGSLTHVSYAVIHQMQAGVKMLAFHIPYTEETPRIAVSLSSMYKKPLDDYLDGAIETGKVATGDSEQLSSQNLILSNRVFVYHETYLSPEQIIEARNAWKSYGVTVIFRGTDYLENKKLEIPVKQLEKNRQ